MSEIRNNFLKSIQKCPFRPPVWIILFVIGLQPFDQLRVDSKRVLAVGEGVPHLGCVEVQFRMDCRDPRCCVPWKWNTDIGIAVMAQILRWTRHKIAKYI